MSEEIVALQAEAKMLKYLIVYKHFSLSRQLNHPYVLRFYGIVCKEEVNYIVTEYCQNGSLLDYLAKNPNLPYSAQFKMYKSFYSL